MLTPDTAHGTNPATVSMAGYEVVKLGTAEDGGIDLDDLREKATHNITTAQTLNALAGVVYLSWLGRRGLVELGELLLQRTHYAREALCAIEGVDALHEQPVVREFAVRLAAPVERVIERCAAEGVNPGHPLGPDYPEFADGLLVAITEQRSRGDIDRLARVLEAAVAAERETARA